MTISLFAQNDYYWSAGKKHFLTKQKSKFIVKLENSRSFETVTGNLTDKIKIQKISKINEDIGIITLEDTLSNAKDLKKEQKVFSNVMPAYQLGDLPFYLTGEILIELKDNVKLNDILNLINVKKDAFFKNVLFLA